MKFKNIFLLFLLLTLSVLWLAETNFSQDNCGCEKILANGIFNTIIDVRVSDIKEIQKNWFCSVEYETFKSLTDHYVLLGIELPDFLADIGYNYTEDQFKTWKSQKCSSIDIQISKTELIEKTKKVAAVEIVKEFNECINACDRPGLYCSLTSLDSQNLIYFLRWKPASEPDRINPPKIEEIRLSGSASFLGSTPPLSVGDIVPVNGIAMPLKRNDVTKSVIVYVKTQPNNPQSCQKTVPPLVTEYKIRISIRPMGNIPHQIKNVFHRDANTNGECDRNEIHTHDLCLVPSQPGNRVIVTRLTPVPNSLNCGSGYISENIGVPSENCVRVLCRLSGCGYRWWLGIRECIGNGWYGYDFHVEGNEYERGALKPYEESKVIRLEPEQKGSAVTNYPSQMLAGALDIIWNYSVEVTPYVSGNVLPPVCINEANPSMGNIKASVSPSGSLVLEITNKVM